jgi:hypothetical protein
MTTFRLAPMTADMRVMTVVVLLVPPVMLVASHSSPAPVHQGLLGVVGLMSLLYLSVWFAWRPSRFDISTRGLSIAWPIRSRQIAASDLGEIAVVGREDFRRDYGRGMRVGAGGLWGGFGLLVTSKETLAMYISRTDRFVIIKLRNARTLMITPEDPERFVAALRAATNGAS